jgi:hypothetical protein
MEVTKPSRTSDIFDRPTFCSWLGVTSASIPESASLMGFSEVVPLAPKQAHERYLKERHDGLAIRHGEQMLRAII